MAEKAVITILLAAADVTAIAGQRVRPAAQAQFDAFPFVTLRITDYEQIATHSGPSGFAKTTVTIDAWALNYKDAMNLQNKIRLALQYKSGDFGGVAVKGIMPQGKSEFQEQSADGTASPVYAVSADYVVIHAE